MYKSGIILGLLALLVAAGATAGVSPLCAPCAVIFLGLGAGYLTGVFVKPSTRNATTRLAAINGAIGGVGALLGQGLGTVLNGVLVGPQRAQQLGQAFGLQVPAGSTFEATYWTFLVGGGICLSLLDVILMSGFGALGGMLWWRMSGQNSTPPPPAVVGPA